MGIKTPPQFKQMEYRWLLIELAIFFKPKVYVEIGVKNGYTFYAVAKQISPSGGSAIAVDINPFDISKTPNAKFYQMTSEQFAKEWSGTIDFLFIDGDHRREAVISDFENLFRFVREDTGLIFLHDTYPVKPELCRDGYCSNAWEAARIIRERSNGLHPSGFLYEMITLPGPWAGLSIIRKLSVYRNGYMSHGWMDK